MVDTRLNVLVIVIGSPVLVMVIVDVVVEVLSIVEVEVVAFRDIEGYSISVDKVKTPSVAIRL